MKIIDPNIAMPIRKPNRLAIEKIELRNSRIGMIGSFARSSISTNTTASTRPPASRARLVGSPQPCSGPAHAV